jgi:hypothetical protein
VDLFAPLSPITLPDHAGGQGMITSFLLHDRARQAAEAWREFRRAHGVPPTDRQLACALHCSERSARRWRQAALRLGYIVREWETAR